MKTILNLLLLIGFTASATAQNALADAAKLRAHVDADGYFKQSETSWQVVMPILSDYFDGANLNTSMKGNPFIGGENEARIMMVDEFQSNFKEFTTSDASRKEVSNLLSGGISALSGFDVTYIADGLARFLVSRTKEELSVTFFKRFQEAANHNTHLKTLFPSTSGILSHIGDEVYHYQTYLETLRDAMVKDLKIMPASIAIYADKPSLIPLEHHRLLLQDGLQVTQMLFDQAKPLDIYEYLAHDALMQSLDGNEENTQKKLLDMASGIKISYELLQSLTKNNGDYYTSNEIRALLKDSVTLHLYLGLLWQQTEGIAFTNGTTVHDVFNNIAETHETLNAYKSYLCALSQHVRALVAEVQAFEAYLASLDTDQIEQAAFAELSHYLWQLVGDGIDFSKTFVPGADSLLENSYLRIVESLSNLRFEIRQGRYTSAIIEATTIIEMLGVPRDSLGDVIKYGTFMAGVAQADSSAEVEALIETVALPPGSSFMKKRNDWSVDINAYTGVALGREYLGGIDAAGRIVAITAPVGINLSCGFGDKGSTSLYVPLIDVGAIAAFRFQDANTSDLPKLSLQNIIAPGAYFVYGFPRDIPLSVGIGGQIGPNLRRIDTANTETYAQGWRIGGFLAVDIPIFSLYSR